MPLSLRSQITCPHCGKTTSYIMNIKYLETEIFIDPKEAHQISAAKIKAITKQSGKDILREKFRPAPVGG